MSLDLTDSAGFSTTKLCWLPSSLSAHPIFLSGPQLLLIDEPLSPLKILKATSDTGSRHGQFYIWLRKEKFNWILMVFHHKLTGDLPQWHFLNSKEERKGPNSKAPHKATIIWLNSSLPASVTT